MAPPLSFPCKTTISTSLLVIRSASPNACSFSYIAEVAPPSIRGRLVGFYEIGSQGAQMCGFWVNYAVNKTISSSSRSIKLNKPKMSTYMTDRFQLRLSGRSLSVSSCSPPSSCLQSCHSAQNHRVGWPRKTAGRKPRALFATFVNFQPLTLML